MGRYKELNQNSEPGQYLRSATIGEITCLLAGMNDDQLHKALEITNILVSGDIKENFDKFQVIIDKYIQ